MSVSPAGLPLFLISLYSGLKGLDLDTLSLGLLFDLESYLCRMLVYLYCFIPYPILLVPILSCSLVYPIPYLVFFVPYCVILFSRARESVWA